MLLGLAIQYGTLALGHQIPPLVARGLGFVAGGCLVYGGAEVARAKGYTPWVGFVTILSFFGVGFLLMMPDPTLSPALRWLARKPDPGTRTAAETDADV